MSNDEILGFKNPGEKFEGALTGILPKGPWNLLAKAIEVDSVSLGAPRGDQSRQ